MSRITGVVLVCVLGVFTSMFAGEVTVVETTGEKIEWIAQNQFYKIVFANTGSINEIFFKGSGKGIKSVYLGHESVGKYKLYKNAVTTGEIKKVSDTEFELILAVTYIESPSKVTVKYIYTFYADKPVVKVNIKLAQKTSATHFVRLNDLIIATSYFTNWAVGEDFKTDAIGTKHTARATNWKAGYSWSELYNFEDALGIITIGKNPSSFIYCYTPKTYYINGCTLRSWKTLEYSMEQYLYIGPSENGKAVQNWARKLKGVK